MRLPNHQVIEYASTYHVSFQQCRAITRTNSNRPNGHLLKCKRSMKNQKLQPSLNLPITVITNHSLALLRYPLRGRRSVSWEAASYQTIPPTNNTTEIRPSNLTIPANPSSTRSTPFTTQQQDLYCPGKSPADHIPLDLHKTEE